jgi:hypothetical protein
MFFHLFRRIWIGVLLIALLSGGCSAAQQTPRAASMPAPTVSAASTLTPSVTPPPSRTPNPTSTAAPSATPMPGCLEPPDDYTRVDLPNATLNRRTYEMLLSAQELYGGSIDILDAITQGSYTDAEEASFGTHSGGGAVDLSVIDTRTWTVLEEEIEPLIHALRLAGFAAWLRPPDVLYPGSPIHIHAVAVGDAELSYAAWLQVYGAHGYLAGMDGLPPPQGQAPNPDVHGGPLLCAWME